jgi:hypothetical protein
MKNERARAILFVIYFLLLINWTIIIFSTTINDVKPSDELGLFSELPLNYSFSLVTLVILTLVSIYLKENLAAILFVTLFALYFSMTPWIIEPLRVPDTLVHYSRVVVLNNLGHTPSTQDFYFDFPGSTFLGSSLLLITGLNGIVFLKYLFPALYMLVFYLGFSLFTFDLFKDTRVVVLGLLAASLFGYGTFHFSPEGIALMLLPLMLFTCGRRRYSLCFLILAFALVITNPTTCAFLLLGLVAYVLVLRFLARAERHAGSRVMYQTSIFAAMFFSWSFFNSPTMMLQVSIFIHQSINNLSSGAVQVLTPSVLPLVETSLARRIFVLFATLLSVIVLVRAAFLIRKQRIPKSSQTHLGHMVGPSIILVGLAMTFLFYVATPQNPFLTRSISIFLLGTCLGIGLLNINSKKTYFFVASLLLILVIPAFIYSYATEQYDITRTSVMQGLIFTGNQLASNPGEIACPFGSQLQAFTEYDLWKGINDMSIPQFAGSSPEIVNFLQIKYFVYRVDAEYYSLMAGTPYLENYLKLLSSGDFNQIYSSGNFALLSQTGNR